jgi:type IV pilus assembly protein PilW
MKRTPQRGFSIVEMMVAITIGLFLLAGAISVFLTSKTTYNIQDDLGRIQENARFTLEQLTFDLRMAGYYGCSASLGEVHNHVVGAAGGTLLDTTSPVEGFESGTAAWLPSGNVDVAGIVPDTDAITIRYFEPTGVQIAAEMAQSSSDITLTPLDSGLKQGEVVAVSDCASADIIQITGPAGAAPGEDGLIEHTVGEGPLPQNAQPADVACGAGAPANCLSKNYDVDAQILRLAAYRYFIGSDPDGDPALFRIPLGIDEAGGSYDLTTTPEQLVDGVEAMQITYGVDSNGDQIPDFYVPANDDGTGVPATGVDLTTADGWNNVIGVRIGLLFRSVEETAPDVDSNAYTVNGVDYGPFDDRRRRRVFQTSVLMRNMKTR